MTDNAFSYFVDSNIWLYAFIKNIKETHKSEISQKIILSNNIVISTQVLNEVCVNLIKKAKFTEDNIQELVQDFYSNYQVIDIDSMILISASKLRHNYSFSYWDSLIVASALKAKVEILYSEDMQNGLVVDKRLKVINPF
jgi:predicted nucleic acid-binding protein